MKILLKIDDITIKEKVELYFKKLFYEISDLDYFNFNEKNSLILINSEQNIGIVKNIRKKSNIPIIVFDTKEKNEEYILEMFKEGIDDYVKINKSFRELESRIKNKIKQKYKKIKKDEKVFIIDYKNEKVFKNNEILKISKLEYQLMKLFLENENKIFSKDELINLIWNYDYCGNTNMVAVAIKRLRNKIGKEAEEYLRTKKDFGYYITQKIKTQSIN